MPSPSSLIVKMRTLSNETPAWLCVLCSSEMVHPWADSCRYTQLLRFRDVFSYMMPAYAALHFIPPILFRQKQFLRDPLAMLLRSFKGTLRSCTFISTFVVIFQSLVCLRHQTWWFGKNLPGPIRKAWLSKY